MVPPNFRTELGPKVNLWVPPGAESPESAECPKNACEVYLF
jgi:hypothetical protein